jgi:hypothetical protein
MDCDSLCYDAVKTSNLKRFYTLLALNCDYSVLVLNNPYMKETYRVYKTLLQN